MKIAAIIMNLGIPIPQSIPKVNCFSVAPILSAKAGAAESAI